MKYFVKFFVITFLIFQFNNALAQINIVYIDMNKVINESEAGKSIQTQLEETHKKNMNEFEKTEKNLKEEEQKILAKKNILSKDEYQSQINSLRTKVSDYQKNRRDTLNELSNKRNIATKKLIENIQPILTDYSKKNKIGVIIDKKNVILGKVELDITVQAIQELNSKISNIPID